MRIHRISKLIAKKVLILMCIFFLGGCETPPMSEQEKEAEEKAMLAYLVKKYNRSFVMGSMEERRPTGFGVPDTIEAEWRDDSNNLFTVSRSDPSHGYSDTYFGIAVEQLMNERYATDITNIGDEVRFTISVSTRGPEIINPSVTNGQLEVYADIMVLVDSSYKREDHYVAIQQLLKKLRDERFYSLVLHINFLLNEDKSKGISEHYLDSLSYSEFSSYEGIELEPYEDSIEFVKALYR